MRYIFRGLMIAIIIICSIPTFILAVVITIWRWDLTALSAYLDDVFNGNLRIYITKDWDV